MKTILLVDDSSTARMFIRRCLQIAGCQDADFREAGNGRQALDMMKATRFDLIMVDLNMPVLDGRSLLKRIKASPRLCATPVVVISSTSNPAAEDELLAAGAYTVLSKPVTPAIFLSSIGSLIEKGGVQLMQQPYGLRAEGLEPGCAGAGVDKGQHQRHRRQSGGKCGDYNRLRL